MHKRAALNAGEYSLIDCLSVLLFTEDEAAAGTAEGFVGGGGHNVGIGYRGGVLSGGDKTCNCLLYTSRCV